MPVAFDRLALGEQYGRPYLADVWGYESWNAFARGVFTPAGDNKIVLFVTREKQEALTQYRDHFEGDQLQWEGETNHANDERISNAATTDDQIHLFFRERHHSDFTYFGQMTLEEHTINRESPSRFVFNTLRTEALAASSLATEAITHGQGDDFQGDPEGRRRYGLHITHERSPRNRAEAIRRHGTICHCCGFDFNRAYGSAHARDYIEIHHVKSLAQTDARVNPATDLVPLCSNCHSMVHRRRGEILPVAELKELMRLARG